MNDKQLQAYFTRGNPQLGYGYPTMEQHLASVKFLISRGQKCINLTLFKMKLHRMILLRLSDLAGIMADNNIKLGSLL